MELIVPPHFLLLKGKKDIEIRLFAILHLFSMTEDF